MFRLCTRDAIFLTIRPPSSRRGYLADPRRLLNCMHRPRRTQALEVAACILRHSSVLLAHMAKRPGPGRRFIIGIVLASWLAPAAFPHLDRNADACDPVVVRHDHSAHKLGSAPEPSHPNHCLLCHWLRSFGSPLSSDTGSGVRLASRPLETLPGLSAHRLLVVDRLPARAPPVHIA